MNNWNQVLDDSLTQEFFLKDFWNICELSEPLSLICQNGTVWFYKHISSFTKGVWPEHFQRGAHFDDLEGWTAVHVLLIRHFQAVGSWVRLVPSKGNVCGPIDIVNPTQWIWSIFEGFKRTVPRATCEAECVLWKTFDWWALQVVAGGRMPKPGHHTYASWSHPTQFKSRRAIMTIRCQHCGSH